MSNLSYDFFPAKKTTSIASSERHLSEELPRLRANLIPQKLKSFGGVTVYKGNYVDDDVDDDVDPGKERFVWSPTHFKRRACA